MTVASLITVLRFPLLVVVVLILYAGGAPGQLLSVFLIVVLIFMDTLDGVVARRRHEETLFGSVLDIAADRAVEIVLWVVFAHLRLIPVAIPITVIIRGALTDSFRGLALTDGESAHSMMRSRWGHWLVASRVMRSGYGLAKVVAFMLLAWTLSLRTAGDIRLGAVWNVALVVSWIALALCLVRGAPVVVEAAMSAARRASRSTPPPSAQG